MPKQQAVHRNLMRFSVENWCNIDNCPHGSGLAPWTPSITQAKEQIIT